MLNRSSEVCRYSARSAMRVACIMGLSLFDDIRYSEHPPEDK
jgi:hypothetical protein